MKYVLTMKIEQASLVNPLSLPIEHDKDVQGCKEKSLVLVALYRPDTRAGVLSHYKLRRPGPALPHGFQMGSSWANQLTYAKLL